MDIVIVGCGNVGTYLAETFTEQGLSVVQVYNRRISKARKLASVCNCEYTSSLRKVRTDADVYFLTISDSAIRDISEQIRVDDGLVIHCSGATDISVLSKSHVRCGVMWPVETIKEIKTAHSRKFTLFYESTRQEDLKIIRKLGKTLTSNIQAASSDERLRYHLAAVLVNNYVNHLYHLAEDFLNGSNLDFEKLYPIIQSTAKGIIKNSPQKLQTGPAFRDDRKTITKHQKILKDHPDLKRVYKTMYESIRKSVK